ncbi:unnamed protein product [Prunus brigantina]
MEWLFLSLALLLLSLVLPTCTSQDNLQPGKCITGNLTLISSLGTFALGFFSPENFTKYFLGICGDGNVVVLDIMDRTRKVIWSSNISVAASAMKAITGVLMDNGNLELRLGEDTLWQSFDHPFDTFLPGMKLSLNIRTGQQRGIDPKVPGQTFFCKENAPYWRSDLYIGKQTNTAFDVDGENAPSSNGTAYFLTTLTLMRSIWCLQR